MVGSSTDNGMIAFVLYWFMCWICVHSDEQLWPQDLASWTPLHPLEWSLHHACRKKDKSRKKHKSDKKASKRGRSRTRKGSKTEKKKKEARGKKSKTWRSRGSSSSSSSRASSSSTGVGMSDEQIDAQPIKKYPVLITCVVFVIPYPQPSWQPLPHAFPFWTCQPLEFH